MTLTWPTNTSSCVNFHLGWAQWSPFSGLVRDFETDSTIESLSLQHYPGMTEKLLQEIVGQVNQRWNLIGTRVTHRVGKLLPGDQIVFVGVASEHRADAFEAAQFLMDYRKDQSHFLEAGEPGWSAALD